MTAFHAMNRYIFREMVPPFTVSVMFFSLVFLMSSLMDITDLVVNYHMPLTTVLFMLACSMPFFLEFIVPMAVMMAVLLTFLRMTADNEIIALKAAGVSIYRMLPPVLLFCALGWTISSWMAFYGLPWGKLAFKEKLYETAVANFDIGLQERTFIDRFDGIVLYVSSFDVKNRLLIDVFIEDRRRPDVVSTVTAPRGRLSSEPERLTGRLQLYDGMINNVALSTRSVHTISFDTYSIQLSLESALAPLRGTGKNKEEMRYDELRRFLADYPKRDARYYSALIELHEKFAVPVACFCLGLLAVPLGMQPMAGGRSFGLLIGLIFFLFYYLMLTVGWSLGESGAYPPALGMWAPNIIAGGSGLLLLVRTAREKPLPVDSAVIWLRGILMRCCGESGCRPLK